jgi:hypothetical protein
MQTETATTKFKNLESIGLLHLSQECAEVTHMATKALLYGIKDTFNGQSCQERLEYEVNDLIACIDFLIEHNVIRESHINYKNQVDKRARIYDMVLENRDVSKG